jgi:DNA invertase Pin-like site-specific DNA recombinase
MTGLSEFKKNEVIRLLKMYHGCVNRVAIESGVSLSTIRKYFKDVIQREKERFNCEC